MRILNLLKQNAEGELWAIFERAKGSSAEAAKSAGEIVSQVKTRGDEALFEYTKQFDNTDINAQNVRITKTQIANAYKTVDNVLVDTIKHAAKRIRGFHEKQKRAGFIDTYPGGELMGQLVRPIERAGVYCPGGTAPYPSSVLMNIIPAKVAGVPRIIMCTPPNPAPALLVAADLAGADEIYQVGGAQAIAALAYGTATIPKVDKITGPGNIFVAEAKRAVYGEVSIDSIAGPSEILIIADDTANPAFIVADMLAQAEHDTLAAAVLLTTSDEIAARTAEELNALLAAAPRRDIAQRALDDNGVIATVPTLEKAFEISNKIAPEHLELCVQDAFGALGMVQNAGAVFLGNYTPEALGDYIAGPNHILPTGGTARFSSPLCVDDFYKKTSVLYFNKTAFSPLAEDCIRFAEAEGLYAHAGSVKIRL